MVLAEPACPGGDDPRQPLPQGGAPVELDPVTLAIVEPQGLDPVEPVERPGQAGGRILAAGEQHQRGAVPGADRVFAIVLRPDIGVSARPEPGRAPAGPAANRCQIQAAMFSAVGFSRPSISFEAMVVEPRQQPGRRSTRCRRSRFTQPV